MLTLWGLVNGDSFLPVNSWVGKEEKLAFVLKDTEAWNLCGNSNIFQAMAFPNLETGN